MQVSILHPFTPQAAGAVEKSVATYHSQPHLKALQILSSKMGYTCAIDYFTTKLRKYHFNHEIITYNFFPVDFSFNKDHTKWKKQKSRSCFNSYKKNTPDVTIINMSGHSSLFSYKLSKLILKKNKKYIAMLGGQHYTDTNWTREYYMNAHHILVHTQMQKETMQKMDMFHGRDIRVFPLGVDCEVFKPGIRENCIKKPLLLYVGRIVEWKRIHMAISATKTLKDNGFDNVQLNIIGPVISETYFVQLKKMIDDFKLRGHVHFLGHKEHYELPNYFREADLLTLPSDKETFGMVMIEAMASGTPVAGIDCPGGPKDVITHLKNGILTSPENYSTAILDFFNNPEQAIEVSKNALNKAVKEYSMDATYKVLKRSIQSALDQN